MGLKVLGAPVLRAQGLEVRALGQSSDHKADHPNPSTPSPKLEVPNPKLQLVV